MTVKVRFFQAGYCTHSEQIVLNNHQRTERVFPALWALIETTPRGFTLFDTGYSEYFFQETRKFPYNIYAKLTPVSFKQTDGVREQLQQLGIKPEQIKQIILSHFHADHIAGCRDFPNARFICSQVAYNTLRGKQGLAALRHGFIPRLLPEDFTARILPLEDYPLLELSKDYEPFTTGYDLYGDRSVIAVWLPGHACGQFGLMIKNTKQSYFLISDAAWLTQSYQELRFPHPVTKLLFNNAAQNQQTLTKIHQFSKLHPQITIVPSHCAETIQRLGER